MAGRTEYVCALIGERADLRGGEALEARRPTSADAEGLAELMLDAYRGTIDFDGSETLDDARGEVASFFEGDANPPLLGCSWLYADGDVVLAACLVTHWTARGCPLVAYVMTRADHKGQGLAGRLVRMSLTSLRDAGYREVRAAITDGNVPSERIFAGLGFAATDAR